MLDAPTSMSCTRSRRVITGGHAQRVGRFPSQKVGRMIHWESTLERDLILQLEFDRDVLGYREQPDPIRLIIGGKSHTYTPDFEVWRRNGRVIIEVKAEAWLLDTELQDRLAAAHAHFAGEGIRFEVLTERLIRAQPRLENLELLVLRHSKTRVIQGALRIAQEVLSANANVKYGDLACALGRAGIDRAQIDAQICAMIRRHDIEADLRKALSPTILVLPN